MSSPIPLYRISRVARRFLTSWQPNQSTSATQPLHRYTDAPLTLSTGADVVAPLHRSLQDMVAIDEIQLSGRVFNAPIRPDLVHRTVVWQLAKRRAGTAKTKNRAEVAGSGRKIRPQKGTGRSRQGAITSPIFVGGGRAHGPRPRSYDYTLPFNVRRNALRSVLSSKYMSDQLFIVDSAAIAQGRTRHLADTCERYGWRSVFVIDDVDGTVARVDKSLRAASGNLHGVLAMNALGLNVYDVLSFEMLVMTRSALSHVSNRFEKYEWLI